MQTWGVGGWHILISFTGITRHFILSNNSAAKGDIMDYSRTATLLWGSTYVQVALGDERAGRDWKCVWKLVLKQRNFKLCVPFDSGKAVITVVGITWGNGRDSVWSLSDKDNQKATVSSRNKEDPEEYIYQGTDQGFPWVMGYFWLLSIANVLDNYYALLLWFLQRLSWFF